MTELKTNPSLLDALQKASAQPPTAEEIESQRVSFIMGALKHDSPVTRAQVQNVLAKQEGRKGS